MNLRPLVQPETGDSGPPNGVHLMYIYRVIFTDPDVYIRICVCGHKASSVCNPHNFGG